MAASTRAAPAAPFFDATQWAESDSKQQQVADHLANDDLERALTVAFGLPGPPDRYIYRAMAAVTLPQAQRAVSLGRTNGLHAWYLGPSPLPTDTEDDAATAAATAISERALENPSASDIEAYTTAFQSSATAAKALASLAANARRGSLRAQIGAYLADKRHLDTDLLGGSPGRRKAFFNPAIDFWAWSCRALEWGGPCEAATRSHMAHPSLPVFMHHFGCVAPSYEALEIIRLVVERRRRILAAEWAAATKAEDENENEDEEDGVAKSSGNKAPRDSVQGGTAAAGAGDGLAAGNGSSQTKKSKGKKKKKKGSAGSAGPGSLPRDAVTVVDMGSGNGYWTYMLRRHGLNVVAVDSGQSVFRTTWIGDTIDADGAEWLRVRANKQRQQQQQQQQQKSTISSASIPPYPTADVLLLVYPVVGGDFTRAMLGEFASGDDLVVAGTQNANGYTGFADMTMADFAARELLVDAEEKEIKNSESNQNSENNSSSKNDDQASRIKAGEERQGERDAATATDTDTAKPKPKPKSKPKSRPQSRAGRKWRHAAAQVPLPSFAGKDDALHVYCRD